MCMCMGMHSLVFALGQAVILLTVSFFVLLSLAKVDNQALKTFGYAIAVLLWISAALVFAKGLAGHHMMHRMHIWGKMHGSMMTGKPCNATMPAGMQQQTPTGAQH